MESYLKNLAVFFNQLNQEDYPWEAVVLGFGYTQVFSQQEMLGRVTMLAELLDRPYKLELKEGRHILSLGEE